MSTILNSCLLWVNSVSHIVFPLVVLIVAFLVLNSYSLKVIKTIVQSLSWSNLYNSYMKYIRGLHDTSETTQTHTVKTSILSSMFLLNFTNIKGFLQTHSISLKSRYYESNTARQNIIFQNIFEFLTWTLLRIPYYVYNWVYSTNHKRIAVNYFWFVILSGICGMILATIIRLEMAYPGIGILAGDSLQYLSIVTAHAVIMVFFMIMPLLLGAFGNFLLPTQLGVHDVAFPRLNSAAFWFVPGGLLMLAQLVCLDRRYQRMNCFNIRELQTLLKNKYHPDLVDDSLATEFLSELTLSTRFKLFNSLALTPRMGIFNDYSISINDTRNVATQKRLRPIYSGAIDSNNHAIFSQLVLDWVRDAKMWIVNIRLNALFSFTSFSNLNFNYSLTPSHGYKLESTTNSVTTPTYGEFITLPSVNKSNLLNSLYTTLVYNWYTSVTSIVSIQVWSFYTDFGFFNSVFDTLYNSVLTKADAQYSTVSNHINVSNEKLNFLSSLNSSITTSGHEAASDYRFQKTTNPVFKYDFKVGNYMPDSTKTLNQHLFTTFNDITGGLRKPVWFFSNDFFNAIRVDFNTYLAYFSTSSFFSDLRNQSISFNSSASSIFFKNSAYLAQPTPTMGFFNFFASFTDNSLFTNTRWLSLKSLDQKFHNMYATASMQQRVYENWRQLKFTREAWRCRLLAARHQNSLYRRYIHEDSVVWAVERNAKDLLPGWAMITPFSARTRFTAIGKVDIGLMGVFLVINSSIVSSANFLVTYRYLSTLNNRKMRDARSFFAETMMASSWMIVAANPMLALAIIMLLSDRHWQTSFFDYSGGGDTVLFQHMFWFFGHPEVYIIMIPVFGFNNTIISFYLRKRVSARASLMYSLYTIAFLGFFVWGHHMYMVGLAHTTRMLFSTLTVMISVPAATKLMHWCVTIANSSITLELPLIMQFLFIFFFVSGGVSGMCVAHTGMDVLFHDSFYVVGHFHVMLASAAMFGSFGAFYFYFPAIFGVKFSRIFAYLHLVYYLLGQLMTILPMIWLGYAGMPRRVLDYPASMGGWHAIASAGHLLSVAGMTAFFIMIFDSMRHGRAVVRMAYGVPRFNTRLNFYIYEGARTWFLQRKGWYISRTSVRNELTIKNVPFQNNEILETTLFSYVLVNQSRVSTH